MTSSVASRIKSSPVSHFRRQVCAYCSLYPEIPQKTRPPKALLKRFLGSALYFQPPSLSKLVDPVVKAAEKLNKAIEHRGYLKIKTATERRFEQKAQLRNVMQQANMTRRKMEKQQKEASRRREQGESQP